LNIYSTIIVITVLKLGTF